jgi:glutathione S-transferase
MVLEELSIPYEVVNFSHRDCKKPPFINLNPNGRVPGIQNPTPEELKANAEE